MTSPRISLEVMKEKHLDLESINYDLQTIVIEQHDLHEKYRQKLEELELTM